jgi:hypothetical protein
VDDWSKLVGQLHELRDAALAVQGSDLCDEEPELVEATKEALSALAEVLTPGLRDSAVAGPRRTYATLRALCSVMAEGATVVPPLGMRSVRDVLKTLSRWVLASTPLPTTGPLAGARIELVDSLTEDRVLVVLRLEGEAQPEDIAADAAADADLLELCDLATDFAPESSSPEVPVIVASRSATPGWVRLWATNEAAAALVGGPEPREVPTSDLAALKARFRSAGALPADRLSTQWSSS